MSGLIGGLLHGYAHMIESHRQADQRQKKPVGFFKDGALHGMSISEFRVGAKLARLDLDIYSLLQFIPKHWLYNRNKSGNKNSDVKRSLHSPTRGTNPLILSLTKDCSKDMPNPNAGTHAKTHRNRVSPCAISVNEQ